MLERMVGPDRVAETFLALPRGTQVVVNAAIENGLYVIIDYHAHAAERDTQAAVAFFSEMASLYGGYNNVIYEIYNESFRRWRAKSTSGCSQTSGRWSAS